MFSARVSSSLGENLTPARRIGDDGVFNVMFSMEASPWGSVYLNSLPKRNLFSCGFYVEGIDEQPKIQTSSF